ncbi:mitochondrial metalloendopeptidase OMA1-like [Silene latifolia]|uniref:mitochondrial metalloendopeptidase OMA1-like n=1 Tax=Silene latifolia TaxID=37657 RepID=UPI003D77F321
MVGLESSSYIDRGHRAKDLEGLVWKVLVINSKKFNAHLGPYNTIFICSNVIDRCFDEELAFIIGHEMGHDVGRHEEYEEMWNPLKSIIKEAVMLIAFLFSSEPCPTDHEEEIKLKQIINNLHRRRNEYDADHIGMMLMASAGYDPRGAPIFLSKNISLFHGGVAGHPRGSKRVAYLKKPKKNEESYEFV